MYRKLQPQVQRLLDSYAALRSHIYTGDYDSSTPCSDLGWPALAKVHAAWVSLHSDLTLLPSHEVFWCLQSSFG